jgi:prophage regulatory protein
MQRKQLGARQSVKAEDETGVAVVDADLAQNDRFIRTAEVLRQTGLSHTGLYERMKSDPEFPRPLRLGHRTNVFSERQIQRWIRAKLEAAAARRIAA